jgi:hypothetical protein
MTKTIAILVCLLVLVAGMPLFARGQEKDHGRFWNENPQRWNGSPVHPAFHGWCGWGKAPCRAPDGIPAEEPNKDPPQGPKEDPGDKPGQGSGGKPGDTPMGGKGGK